MLQSQYESVCQRNSEITNEAQQHFSRMTEELSVARAGAGQSEALAMSIAERDARLLRPPVGGTDTPRVDDLPTRRQLENDMSIQHLTQQLAEMKMMMAALHASAQAVPSSGESGEPPDNG